VRRGAKKDGGEAEQFASVAGEAINVSAKAIATQRHALSHVVGLGRAEAGPQIPYKLASALIALLCASQWTAESLLAAGRLPPIARRRQSQPASWWGCLLPVMRTHRDRHRPTPSALGRQCQGSEALAERSSW
jgi:hypothetical protein